MMDASSPVKRRVLGALDPNAWSPSKARRHEGAKQKPVTPTWRQSPIKAKSIAPRQEPAARATTSPTTRVSSASPSSPRSPSPSPSQSLVPDTPERGTGVESRKRRSPSPSAADPPSSGMAAAAAAAAETEAAEEREPAAKRACLDGRREDDGQVRRLESPPSSTPTTRTTGTTRHRSASPDTPSVFDNSAVDNSQVTVLTEPDAAGPNPAPVSLQAPLPAPRAQSRLTREQAREKAEILRLRLGLASYKVRTGQTDVPLDRLEARLAGAAGHARGPSSSFSHGQTQSQGQSTYRGPTTSVSASFPPPRATTAAAGTTQREHRRPLPGAPVRRASVGTERAHYASPAPPSRRQPLEEGRLGPAGEAEQDRDRYHDDRHQSPHNHYHHNHQLHHDYRDSHAGSRQYRQQQQQQQQQQQHQQHQYEAVLDTRHDPGRHRSASNPSDRRPHTATDVLGSSLSSPAAAWPPSPASRRRAASFAGNGGYRRREERADESRRRAECEEDVDGRGGAASGLLSLARS
ncbi:hypothetical protein VTH06DRAFT_2158 [Thermothelomyces fergusii]